MRQLKVDKRIKNGVIGFVVLFGIISMGFGEMRTWTSKTGQTIEAEYVRNTMGKVWLKTSAGKQKQVPISALLQADQDYIYSQTLPKIRIEVDDDIDRSTVGSDIDNVLEEIRCTIEVKKTSKNPFPMEYEFEWFLLGCNIEYKEYIVAEKVSKKFHLNEANDNTFSFSGEVQSFEHDPSPPWGSRYEGYLVVVKAQGKIICTKGKKRYLKNLRKLRDASNKERLDEDFNKSNRRRNRNY